MINIFLSFAVTGIAGAVLALVICLTKNIIRRHFPSQWLYYMWAAVLIVMILPLRFDLSEIKDNGHNDTKGYSHGEVMLVVSEPKHIDDAVTPDNETNASDDIVLGTHKQLGREYAITDILRIVSYIWLICAISLFAYKVISYMVFYISVIKNSTETDVPEIKKYTRRKLRVRVCHNLSSPLMTGILFPVLFLPDTELSGDRLEYVLMHETVHLNRFDIILKWFSMAVSCIHFYNPAVYLVCKELSAECEISCDALIVKNMDKDQKRAYVETILSLLSLGKTVKAPLTTGMTGKKSLLRTRFTLIKERKSTGRLIMMGSIAVSAVLLAVVCIISGVIGGFVPKEKAIPPEITVFDTKVNDSIDTKNMYIGMINAENTSLMDILDGNGNLIMTIPTAVAEQFPDFQKSPGKTALTIFCGKIDDFLWAGVTANGAKGAGHTNICTSSDNGNNWFVGNDGYIGKGIVEKIWFVSEKDGYISYSGGGYGKGISKTSDGGITWEHFMEYGYPMPISAENALALLKHQLIIAYENTYGSYIPSEAKPTQAVPDSEYLRYIIENLEIIKEDDEYYTVPVIWDFLIEKETGRIYKFYNGLDKVLTLFDPYSTNALSFAG